jgi:hypothetical protein
LGGEGGGRTRKMRKKWGNRTGYGGVIG